MAAATNAAVHSRPSDGSIQARNVLLAGMAGSRMLPRITYTVGDRPGSRHRVDTCAIYTVSGIDQTMG